MESNNIYIKNLESLEKYENAKNCYKSGDICKAIMVMQEAEQLFAENKNIDCYISAKSYKYKWLYKLKKSDFYKEHEVEVITFLDKYCQFYDDKRYQVILFNYLKYKSLEFRSIGDTYNARDALNELVKLVESNRHNFSFVSPNLLQIWKTQIIAHAAFSSRERQDDLVSQADRFFQAAEASAPLVNDRYSNKMLIFQAEYYSSYHKLLAFGEVNLKRPYFNYKTIIDHLEKSLKFAQDAYRLSGENLRESHVFYIDYWLNVFSMRESIVKSEFDIAMKFLNKAIRSAQILSEREIGFFPNYFANLDDIKNERLLVRAYQLFSKGFFSKSLLKIKKWVEKTSKAQKTWKYNSVIIRLFALELLCELSPFASHKIPDFFTLSRPAVDIKAQLDEMTREVRLGKASVSLAHLIIQLAIDAERKSTAEYVNILKSIEHLFPIDIQIEDPFNGTSINLIEKESFWDVLPEKFWKQWTSANVMTSYEDIYKALDKLIYLYILIITEYHQLKYLNFSQRKVSWIKPLAKQNIDQLESLELSDMMSHLNLIVGGLGKRNTGLEYLQNYVDKRDILFSGKRLSELKHLIQEAIQNTYTRFFPHIIKVMDDKISLDDNGELNLTETSKYSADLENESIRKNSLDIEKINRYFWCKRVWKRGYPSELICSSDWPLSCGKYFFLRPRWKNFNFRVSSKYRTEFELYESRYYKLVENEIERDTNAEERSMKKVLWRLYALEKNLNEFKAIISKGSSEREIGDFLYHNHWILGNEYESIHREFRIDTENTVDFLMKNIDGSYVIIEIKRPNQNLFLKSHILPVGPFRSAAHVEPSREYSLGINQLHNYQKAFKRRCSVEHGILKEVNGLLLIGGSLKDYEKCALEALNEEEQRNFREIMTYDALVERAQKFINKVKKFIE